ncbi:MAG: hypothetical protein ACK5KN_09040 [Dysgonomonas sp.]|uniref:hypothetical protein n=1 Tax=Dysgonomonas sp. TaxID=1891233 RepID=UPI003A8C781D
MALPKTNQKASASFDLTPRPLQREREPKPVCRLKVTNGLLPSPFASPSLRRLLILRRLHRVGAPPASLMRGS